MAWSDYFPSYAPEPGMLPPPEAGNPDIVNYDAWKARRPGTQEYDDEWLRRKLLELEAASPPEALPPQALPSQAHQVWNPDNPVGTETIRPRQSMSNPDPSFRPAVFAGGGSVPMSAEQIDTFREGSQNFYDQVSNLAGMPAAGPAVARVAASRRLLAKPPPPSRRVPSAGAPEPASLPEPAPLPGLMASAEPPAPLASLSTPPTDLLPAKMTPRAAPDPASGLAESLLTGSPPRPPPAGTDALPGGLLSPAKNVQAVYDAALEGMDTGIRAGGRQVRQGKAGTMAGVPSLRPMDLPQAIEAASQEPHLILKADGSYVGAPHWIKSRADLTKMRADFDAKVAAGAPGGDWYERVRQYAREVSGKDPQLGRQIAEELGLFSPQSDPNTNLLFSLQANDAFAAGKPLPIVRTGQQGKKFSEMREAQYQAWLNGEPLPGMKQGDKTGVFEGHMDWTRPGGTTGTNDIWHARALGYVNPKTGKPWSAALGAEQHQFMDHETVLAVKRANDLKIGGRADWTAAEIQAAPWVAGKAEDLARRFKLTPEEGTRRATSTYPDYAPQFTATVPAEQIPGAGTGVTTGSMTPQAFHDAATWTTPIGNQDAMSRILGHRTRQSVEGTGAYTPEGGPTEFNPVTIGQPQVSFTKPGGTKAPTSSRTVPDYTQAGLGGGQAVRGLMDFQHGSPWSIIDTQAPGATANSLRISTGGGPPPSAKQMQALEALGKKHNFTVANTGDGVNFLNFETPGAVIKGERGAPDRIGRYGKDVSGSLKKGLAREIDAIMPGATVQRGRGHGDYVDLAEQLSKENQGKGLATSAVIDRLAEMHKSAPAAFSRLLDAPELAAKAKANLARLDKSGQMGARPDYEELLRLIESGRLRGLLERVQRQGTTGLPAAIGLTGLGAGTAGGAYSTDSDR